MKTTPFIITLLSIMVSSISIYAQDLKLPGLYSIMETDNEFALLKNHGYDNKFIGSLNNSLLWNHLTDALKSGKAKAYSAMDFTISLTPAEVSSIIIGSVDTMYVENPDPPYDLIMKSIERKLEIVQWRFFEDVTYNGKKKLIN